MHWEWVVPVIAVVLWILSSVIRSPEEPPRDLRRRRLPNNRPAQGGEPARPSSEVERFLEEINRLRRRAADGQKPADETREEEPRAEPSPRPEPPPRPQPPSLPRRPRRTPAVVVPPRRAVAQPPPPPPAQAVPVLDVLEVIAAPATPMAKAAQRIPAPAASPAVAQLRTLLASPQNLQTAVLLHEVLGPPRCRRRRS